MINETTIKQFRIHLERLGYSANTVKMLPNLAADFLAFTAKQIQDIEPIDIMAFYEHIKERPHKRKPGGLSEQYINHHIYALKVFFDWQLEKGSLTLNPISALEFPRPKSKPREILTMCEVQELYTLTENLKEKAILSVYYGCGLRRSEGAKLDLKDIHFRTNLLYVREGKNKKRRAVPMSEKVKQDLYNYATKERFARANETAFLCNVQGGRMASANLNKTLKQLVEKAGIQKEITLHCLRHSIATHLLENGLSVEYVWDFLGHKFLESTQIYTRINKKQLWSLNNI